MLVVERIVKVYPSYGKRKCRDCKFYTATQEKTHVYYSKTWKTDGRCSQRGELEVLGDSEACEMYFQFKDASCSICGKPISNYCPISIYVRNLKELKRFGYDGVEFYVSELKGYAILCLDCWKQGVKSEELTYGQTPSIEETE
jgi:hypothetical protein